MARLETGPTDLILETENRASCSFKKGDPAC